MNLRLPPMCLAKHHEVRSQLTSRNQPKKFLCIWKENQVVNAYHVRLYDGAATENCPTCVP